MTTAEILPRLKGVKKSGAGWAARCPSAGHDDKHASLSISEGSDGKLLLQCHANKGCTFESILAAIPHSNGGGANRIVAEYNYTDEAGNLLYQAVRFEPKDFRARKPKGEGWDWNLNGTRRVLYRLGQLLAAKPAQTVLIVEGEKDVDRCAEIGLVATTNAGGAGKWRDEYSEHFRDRKVVILPDIDEPGRKHAQQVANSLHGIAASVKVVELPGLPDKGDVSDWLNNGGTVSELKNLVANTPAFEPKPLKPSQTVCTAPELLARTFSPLRWAIMSLLAEGLFILAGRPKLGKSWLVLNFAVAIATGGYALGTIKVEAGDVLYCALEDGARRLQERLRRALAGGPVPENLYLATEWKPFDRGGLEDLEDWIKAHPNVRLIVFDTLERVRPSEDPKARLYHSDYQAVQGLQDLAKQYGICILVVHHTRKQDSNDHLDLVSGSTGLTGAADGVVILKRARGESDATLTANGRDFVDTELALKFDPELCDWRALGDAAEYRLSNERRDVLELLRRSDPLTPKNISTELKRDYGATKKLLYDMRQAGQLHSDSKGRYSIIGTQAGEFEPKFTEDWRRQAWGSWRQQ